MSGFLVLTLAASFLLCVGTGAQQQHPIQNEFTSPLDRSRLHASDGSEQDMAQATKRVQPLQDMLSALEAMQDTYFNVYGGTWPDAIDWTAAVMGTHVSATLSSLVLGLDRTESETRKPKSCTDRMDWENTINRYYTQTALFYFGENAFALRNQAYDDMLWVVLGWLENIKFAEMYSSKHWKGTTGSPPSSSSSSWHGVQMTKSAAHRARIFYDLASVGWETKLCDGGMLWNPNLEPYKNAITNELFTAASIGMYLYFPGDSNSAPFVTAGKQPNKPHDALFLENAVKSYKWLKGSGMQSSAGLYQDGFHVSGWTRFRNGTIDPGTGQCDALNTMVYTYNQGVILSASRGLWLATGAKSYINDGHDLIRSVINATGWHRRQDDNKRWNGLGRGGVLEEFCDHSGYCSQDGQTFKGIFFHHLAEFCRPLWPQEEDYISAVVDSAHFDRDVYRSHLSRCAAYGDWIEHNAKAALETRDERGLFGMWWGVPTRSDKTFEDNLDEQELPPGADDHVNPAPLNLPEFDTQDLNRRGRGRTVETQSGGLAVLRAHWQWEAQFG